MATTAMAVLVVGALAAAPAEAAFKVSIDSTGIVGAGAAVQVTDNGAGDADATVGIINWSGSVGGFNVALEFAQSKPIIGGSGLAALDSLFAATGLGTLTFAVTDTGYTQGFPGSARTDIGGSTAGTVNAWSYFDITDAEFGFGTLIAAQGPFSGGAFSGSASSAGPSATPFSLTSVVQVTHGVTNNTTTGDHNITVPEPASMLLLGMGMLGLGAIARRRR